jgi:hypothetical protein
VLIENYLLFNYLFIQPKDIDEQRFRWLVFEIGGYNSRQDFDFILDEHKEKVSNEKLLIKKLTEELKKNIYFLKLDDGRKKSILKDKPAKIIGWKRIISDSKINEYIFIKQWYLYSNYIHTEFLSLIQIKDYFKEREKLMNQRSHLLFSSLILSAAYITDIILTYNQIKNKFDFLQEGQKDCIIFLSSIAKNKIKLKNKE